MTWRQQAGNFDIPINPEHEQEARLVDQAKAGSERAFSALLARYQQPVFRLIFYLVGDADEARELARVALKHSLTRMPRVPAGYSMRPWLLRVATLVALDAVRERSESPQALIASLQLPPAPPQPTARIIDADPTLSETMELSITKLEENPEVVVADAWDRLPIDVERELVRRLLASLPENDAELLALGVVGQVPTRDLAAIAGTSQRSIRRRIARALILFQSHYQMVRQETLPPAPPTKELEPGNVSAVMAINAARRGLNEATERMRRSWHNVRASLGNVEVQESLQTLREEDAPAATQTRPLTAPSVPPSAKRVRPTERTAPASPPPATPPVAPPRPPRPVQAEQTVILPPPAAPQREAMPLPPQALPAEAGGREDVQAASVEDLVIAMKRMPDVTPSQSTTHDDPDHIAATTSSDPTEQALSRDEASPLTPSEDDATTHVARDEHADVTPEQPPTAIRQLPRFGPPTEETLPQAIDEAADDMAVDPLNEDLALIPPARDALADDAAILMPAASADEHAVADDEDFAQTADVVMSEANRGDSTPDVGDDDENVMHVANTDIAPGATPLRADAEMAHQVITPAIGEPDVATPTEVAAVLPISESDAANIADNLDLDEGALSDSTALTEPEVGTNQVIATRDEDFTSQLTADLPDTTASLDESTALVDDSTAAAASLDTENRVNVPQEADAPPDEALALEDEATASATLSALTDVDDATNETMTIEQREAVAPQNSQLTQSDDDVATLGQGEVASAEHDSGEQVNTLPETVPAQDNTLPYNAWQEARTMPVSRHFGDTVIVRDDQRLEYVSRHQGNPIDLGDLSGIVGVTFGAQVEEDGELSPPPQPPAAGVMNIVPETVHKDDEPYMTSSSDPDKTIIAKPIVHTTREEITDLTQPADLADLAGIVSQTTQVNRPLADDITPAPTPETRPRRVTRPMPRLDRDAPEPPGEES